MSAVCGHRRHLRSAIPVALLLACILVAGCASEPVSPGSPKIVRGHAVPPYGVHEECLRIAAGERLDFDFTATEPVEFNVHYREGNAVVMPIVREKTLADSGLFAPRIAQDYCLMWEAGPAGTALDYRVRLRPATRQ